VRIKRAVYGSIVIPRAFCPDCEEWAFVIKSRLACCDAPATEEGIARARFERMCEAGYKRQIPTREVQRAILEHQGDRCFYCGSAFGDSAHREGRSEPRRLTPVWDHVEPFAWQANNQPLNFVASCSVCNGIKSNLMFESKEDARLYVWRRRKQKGWASATEMRPEARSDAA
jgi:hypothetical protein